MDHQNNPRIPEELFDAFLAQLGPMSGQHAARLFCHLDKPDQVTCIMTVGPNDHTWLNRNGHQPVQGTLTHIFYIDPSFRCVSRPEGSLNTKSC